MTRFALDFYVEDHYADALRVENSYIADQIVSGNKLRVSDGNFGIAPPIQSYKEIAARTNLPSTSILIDDQSALLCSFPSKLDILFEKETLIELSNKKTKEVYEFKIGKISYFGVNKKFVYNLDGNNFDLTLVTLFPTHELDCANSMAAPVAYLIFAFSLAQITVCILGIGSLKFWNNFPFVKR